MKKQKGGSRGAGWKWRWKRGRDRDHSSLSETEVRPGIRGQSLVRVQVAKRSKISENTKGVARVPPPPLPLPTTTTTTMLLAEAEAIEEI